MEFLLRIFNSFKEAAYDTVIAHDGVEHAGYLAFLGMLALFPFLVFVVAIAGFIGQGDAGAQFISLMMSNLPPKAAAALEPRIVEITSGPPQGLLTVAIFGAIWTASSAVEGTRTILNRAYRVSTPPAYWFRRLMSIVQLLFFTTILVLGMLLLVFAPIALSELEHSFGFSIDSTDGSWNNTILSLSGFSLFAVVANLYYILPNIKQRLSTVLPGALLAVGMWIGAASLFSVYLSNFDQVNLIYGSLGGIIAALIFFYIINLIFIFGAEFNYHLANARGEEIEEKEHADDV